MLTLGTAVFVASLLGSLHCAGMCGPFAVFAASGDRRLAPRGLARMAPLASYHAARLVCYVGLGAVFGLVGSAVNFGGALTGVQRAAGLLAGVTLIGIGVIACLQYLPLRVQGPSVPAWLRGTMARGHRAAAGLPPVRRAALIGLLTVLLPCGWLYAFVLAAAGTGSAASGALVMLCFWAGTAPILVGVSLTVRHLSAWLGARVQLVTSAALVLLGVLTITGRLSALEAIAATSGPATGASVTQHVTQLDASQAACCREGR